MTHRTPHKPILALYVGFIIQLAVPAFAQDIKLPVTTQSGASKTSSTTAEIVQEKDDVSARLDALTAAMQAQQEEMQTQQEETNALKLLTRQQQETMQVLTEELALAAEERDIMNLSIMEEKGLETVRKFSVHGFMDAFYTAAFPEKVNGEPNWSSPVFLETHRRSSFYQTGVNLYFKSELTPTLETLVETQFTYQPNGNVSDYPRIVHLQGGGLITEGEYVRADSSVTKHYSGYIRLGGVLIERAQIDWKPRDWFFLRIGRFLSPSGIWRENHGAPVRLGAAEPFLISHNYLPNAQTGMMVGGKIFMGDVIDFDYAITLSNGRGPFDEFIDLDHNKALGLRARINIVLPDLFVSAGAYGYMGKYTSSTDTLHVYLNATGSGFDENVKQPTKWVEDITQKYDEKILATELEFRFKGVQVFGEYVRGVTKYFVPTELEDYIRLFAGVTPDVNAVEANRISKAWYVMAGYQLPLSHILKNVKITPYFGWDRLQPSDVYSPNTVTLFKAGLNIKPSLFLTLKSSVFCIIPKEKKLLGGNTWFWSSQIAVSF